MVFSGDIGRPQQPIIKEPSIVAGADYLIMEATYGNRIHPEGGDAKATLKEIAHKVYEDRGKLIIPGFQRWADAGDRFSFEPTGRKRRVTTDEGSR